MEKSKGIALQTPQEKAKYYVDSIRHMIWANEDGVCLGVDKEMAKEAAAYMIELMLLDIKIDDKQSIYFGNVINEIRNL